MTKKILKLCKIKDAQLSVVFVSHQKIRSLNIKYLKRNHATDVLAFDHLEKLSKTRCNGDVIISTDAAIKNSKTFSSSIRKEVVLYIIHGILHLIGYDDHSKADVKRMRKKEEEVLNKLSNDIKSVI